MKNSLILRVRTALLLTTISALVPALAIIIFTGVEYGRYRERETVREAHRQVESIVSIHNETIASMRRLLETLAAVPVFRHGTPEDQGEILSAILREDEALINIAITDGHGFVTASALLPPGIDLSDRKHVQEAIHNNVFAPGEFVWARVDGNPAFPFAYPLRDESGAVHGAITAVYDLGHYPELFRRFDLPAGTILGITDHKGIRILFEPPMDTNPLGAPISRESWTAMSEGSDSGTVVTAGSDGVTRYHAYRRVRNDAVGDPYLYVVVGYPKDLVTGTPRRILVRNVGLMIGVLLVGCIVSLFLGDAVFSRRFHRLALTALDVSYGRFGARTGIPRGRSEVQRLAEAIDRMAVRLEERDRERDEEAQRLNRSIREKETLLREVHHRVKNNMQLILSLINLQRYTTSDPVVFCGTLETRISAMVAVHETLYRSPDVSTIDAGQLLRDLADSEAGMLSGGDVSPTIHVDVDVEPVPLGLDQALPLALIASELMTNSCKHALTPDRSVTINLNLARQGDCAVFSVTDSGPGISAVAAGEIEAGVAGGLGMTLVSALAEQLDGRVLVDGYVSVRFPLSR